MIYRLASVCPDELFFLPRRLLSKMENAGDPELRIFLWASQELSHGEKEEADLVEAIAAHGFSHEEIRSALSFWRGCGVLAGASPKKKASPPKAEEEKTKPATTQEAPGEVPSAPLKMVDADEAPFYSSLELGEAAEQNPQFKNLVDYAQKKLKKILNTSELAKIWSFLDYLKMPPEVVMLVIEDCCNREKSSLRYISKMLNTFQDEGIDSYEKAEAYFLRREEGAVYERYVRRLFGLGERKLTRAEEEILRTWRITWNFGEDMLEAAYEKTVAGAKNPSIKYMHRILESWHEKGATTPEEAEGSAASSQKAPKSYDSDDFFEAAVAKGLKNV